MGQGLVRLLKYFMQQFLVPKSWEGAVVVRDNLPAHKLGVIERLMQTAGATVLNL